MAKRSKARDSSADFDLDLSKERGTGIKSRVFSGSLAAMVLVGGFGGWAATSELSGAVIGQGQIMVDKDLRSIQHLDGGIIRSILVKKGDAVAEGQVMFTLDDTQLKAEAQILRGQLLELLAKRQRLIAERDGLEEMLPVENQLDLKVSDSAVFAGELRLFKGNRDNRVSQVEQLKLGVAQSDEEINGLTSQTKSNAQELELVQAEANKVEALRKKGLIESSRVYSNARDLNKLKGEREQISSSIARSKSKRNEIQLQIAAIEDTARTDAQKQLSDIEPRISELTERKAAIADRLTRMGIRAPIAGIINEVSVNTIGGIITPAQKLLTIVPQDARLQVEVKVQPNDIDQLYVGQNTKLKFTAFSSRSTPEIFGKIAFVSPATSTDQSSGRVFYIAQVEVPNDELIKLGGKKLVPGMLVETFMQTESRTALSYLIKPFQDQIERAFRER
jgi:HlyD family type I secretion membrane fusion protein